MGLVSTVKDESATRPLPLGPAQLLLEAAQIGLAGYRTSTGSSWAGNVETATFTAAADPLERYISRRGITEESIAKMSREEAARLKSSFPVQDPWWFRQIEPAGWHKVEGGIQWHYKDFKPKDPIEVRYYTTNIPQQPEEVDAFVDSFLQHLVPNRSAAIELARLREILLATYGKEPEDEVAKGLASEQLWYAPQKDFSMASSEAQQTVLKKIDARIATARRAK
jgi:hypothetical protein